MKPQRGKNRRKKFYIDREIQMGITVRFLAIFLAFIFLTTCAVFIPSSIKLLSHAPAEELIQPAQEFLILKSRVWPMALVVMLAAVVYTVIFSHRIAGPIQRLNSELRNIISGNYPERIRLRKKDYFKETASLLEELSQEMEAGRNRPFSIDAADIEKQIEKIKRSILESQADKEVLDELDTVRSMLKGQK
ncbi:MAG: hypothetical protein GTN70_03115 [Deltaproteobacteria bacterium]|nr:hypothetical protein [Deltaproteobacteria bacterium]NIS76637.1 hypothetical protein [Deltaproteobacteria bacterium]